MAFIRRKKVHGHEYYQVVRNYRDRDGKHRQEVLCHLGTHNSLEATIDAEREKVQGHRERALVQRVRANALRTEILDLHGWEFVDGEIPSEADSARQRDLWWRRYDAYINPTSYTFYTGTEFMEFEEADLQIDKYISCLSYHAAKRLAEMADFRADTHQEKLDRLLRVKREYF